MYFSYLIKTNQLLRCVLIVHLMCSIAYDFISYNANTKTRKSNASKLCNDVIVNSSHLDQT